MAKSAAVEQRDKAWAAYWRRPTDQNRNRVAELYLPILQYHAERVASRLPSCVEVGDLFSSGSIGLMESIKAFDPERGTKFETFAAPRIRGAMFDEIRAADDRPRLSRTRQRQLNAIRDSFRAVHGRNPSPEEIEQRGMTCGQRMEAEATERGSKSLETTIKAGCKFEGDSDREIENQRTRSFLAAREAGPYRVAEGRDLLKRAIIGLPRAERLMVVLYYIEGLTMKEIGVAVGVSESRVSQMMSATIRILKSKVQGGRLGEPIDLVDTSAPPKAKRKPSREIVCDQLPGQILTRAEAAEVAGISAERVRQLVDTGKTTGAGYSFRRSAAA